MKNVLKPLPLFLIGALVSIVSCRKDDIINKPGGGGSPAGSNAFRFQLDSLPGEANRVDGLSILYTIVDEQDKPVSADNKIALQYNGKYISDSIILPNGNYKISKFFIINETKHTKFVTPVAGSVKANLVLDPLSISFSLPSRRISIIPMGVARVSTGDLPQNFGYPVGSFNIGNDEQNDPSQSIKVKVKAIFQAGEIVYDSIPALLTVTTWDNNGGADIKTIPIDAGANEVTLSKAASKYQFKVEKWGTTDEMTLLKKDIQEGVTYSLGGSKPAKRLRLEEGYVLVAGSYQPDRKVIYSYNGNGSVNKIDYYQKKPQHSDLQLYNSDQYEYRANKVIKIDRRDQAGLRVGSTLFVYNPEGTKVDFIQEKIYDRETTAFIDYSYPTGHAAIKIDYSYSNGHTMEYKMKFVRGNKVEDASRSSTGGVEGGTYKYDFNINPFAHLNLPNLYLSNLSRNNLISEQKGYGGNIPSGIPYKFEYVYDNEGYPVQLYKSYKSAVTGEHLFTTKTVYSYL